MTSPALRSRVDAIATSRKTGVHVRNGCARARDSPKLVGLANVSGDFVAGNYDGELWRARREGPRHVFEVVGVAGSCA